MAELPLGFGLLRRRRYRPHDGPVRPLVLDQPTTYQMIAIKDGALYGATVLCATAVSPGVRPLLDEHVEKDVAVVKIVPPPFETWGSSPSEGEPIVIARKRQGPLPMFQPLAFGSDPRPGDRVRIAAYGQLLQLEPIPRPWRAEAEVTRVFTGRTGVPLFGVDLASARVNWIPGAVAVDSDGLAVGLGVVSWVGPPSGSGAEQVSLSASALREPCR